MTESLLERADFKSMQILPERVKRERIVEACDQIIASEMNIPLTAAQIKLLKEQVIDDLLGFGPIEVLMSNPDISDIMINGHKQVFIEQNGKIVLTDITFGSERHLLNVIQKIVSIVGRRIDESSPMVDSRMPDGSRFNAIIPPLALDGCLVSIRKFKKQKMSLKDYVSVGSMSDAMYRFLSICGQIRLNIIISGGTGSGKTTLLNSISGFIDKSERIVTIEDAAELQLQQPHVLRMETRPPNMEGAGEVTQRQLVRNALRMRPDRIIIGEIRGDEVIDVLSAMNTGHDGSMATIHANTPRDALSRVENLVGMSAVNLSLGSLRQQLSSAIHLIVQISRQRDGKRRITQIEEIKGLEGDTIVTQTLFGFRPGAMDESGVLTGTYYCTGAKPDFLTQAAYFGKEEEMLGCLAAT
jgi:pilus assembly protein CpaF